MVSDEVDRVAAVDHAVVINFAADSTHRKHVGDQSDAPQGEFEDNNICDYVVKQPVTEHQEDGTRDGIPHRKDDFEGVAVDTEQRMVTSLIMLPTLMLI